MTSPTTSLNLDVDLWDTCIDSKTITLDLLYIRSYQSCAKYSENVLKVQSTQVHCISPNKYNVLSTLGDFRRVQVHVLSTSTWILQVLHTSTLHIMYPT